MRVWPRVRTISTIALGAVFASPSTAQVSGVVTDQATSLPIDGAIVSLQATTERAVTGADGAYSLPGVTGSIVVIAAAKEGYFNLGATVSAPSTTVDFALEAVPQVQDPSYTLQDPQDCASCHQAQYDEWFGSPMSNGGVNTWVYDIYDGTGTPGGMGGFVYTRDSVHAAANPTSECAACHQPEPWVVTQDPHQPLEPIGALSEGAIHGVSCDVCHKIASVDESKTDYPGLMPQQVTFSKPGPGEQVQYGALGDTTFSIPFMRPSYQPQVKAAMCAVCHQDKNDPDGDGIFDEPNGVVSEPTWDEWIGSPYGDPNSPYYATCVDCHMPPSGSTFACNLPSAPTRDPNTIRSHRILGTTPEYLENAVDLAMGAVEEGGELKVEVTITNNNTGHHVPTGVTVRNMILLVEAWRVEDGLALTHTGTQTVHSLGGVGNPSEGYYAGLPGKLYAKHNHDATGHGPTFFTDATGILWDNRIPALASDSTQYPFAVPPGGGTLHVRARLIYRRAFRFLTDAKQWTEDGHGRPLEDVQPPYFGHLMEEAEWPEATAYSYCTAGTTTNGCNATIAGSGVPSATAGAGFDIEVTNVEGDKPGILFYGVNGPAAFPWGMGTSWLCVKGPSQRMGGLNSGGTNGQCDGVLSQDWNAYIASHPGTIGQPFMAGDTVWAQGWFRDPPAPKTTSLSNALEFVLTP